jgi:molecular chaperone GrpE
MYDDDRMDEAREVADHTPGVEAEQAEGQVLMSESSDVEQIPAGEAGAPAEPQVSLAELQRLKADLENARKRMVREQTRAVEHATRNLVNRLMPVIDHFNLAIEHGEAGSGVQLAFKELMEILSAEGLAEIDAQPGEPFDPGVHHALNVHQDPGVDHEQVSQVHRRGYSFKGQVLRAPEVVVAQPTGADEEA